MFKRQHSKFTLCLILLFAYPLAMATFFYGCTPVLRRSAVELTKPAHAQSAQPDKVLTGQVIKVYDGDTILIKDPTGKTTRIRLKGIDAPENKQAYGPEAAEKMTGLSLNKTAEVQWSDVDQYGRTIGKVLIDGTDVCLEMIKAGLAWHFKQYQTGQSQDDRVDYDKAEKEAREQHKGLWADDHPTPPWEFRRQERMNSNGKSGNGDGHQNDNELVDLTLRLMEDSARLAELSDLELIRATIEDPIGDDPRIHELICRINPNWSNDLSPTRDPLRPTYVAISIPLAVARNGVAFNPCRCVADGNNDPNYSPCLHCALKASIYQATQDDLYRPDTGHNT